MHRLPVISELRFPPCVAKFLSAIRHADWPLRHDVYAPEFLSRNPSDRGQSYAFYASEFQNSKTRIGRAELWLFKWRLYDIQLLQGNEKSLAAFRPVKCPRRMERHRPTFRHTTFGVVEYYTFCAIALRNFNRELKYAEFRVFYRPAGTPTRPIQAPPSQSVRKNDYFGRKSARYFSKYRRSIRRGGGGRWPRHPPPVGRCAGGDLGRARISASPEPILRSALRYKVRSLSMLPYTHGNYH